MKKNMLKLEILQVFLVIGFAAAADQYTRADFPPGFVFGAGTAAYQYEGAAFEDGRTPSIWDTFDHSGRTRGANGDVACDGYHKFKDDINLMSDMGLDAFRFSISWSRLIPNGRGPVNPKGLQYYNNFINKLISHGIQPHVTLHHFDLPQALHDEYGGWLSRKIVKDFTAYAEVCFREFGDRVKFWTTVNEANVFAFGGYSGGIVPPGRCSPSIRPGSIGNSSTEPYLVGHNILLAHSATWRLYTENYKATQKGQVGFNLYAWGIQPWTDAEEDVIASQRALDFYVGWLLRPLVFGNYPEVVCRKAKGRIPIITKDEVKQINGSFDFLGVNHYTTILVKDDPTAHDINKWDLFADIAIKQTFAGWDGKLPITEYPVMPSGLYMFLDYLKEAYGNPPIYIHENGQSSIRNGTLNDTGRVKFLHAYIGAVLDAIRNGSNINGYMTWTFFDCLELLDGYDSAYGLYYVDLDDKQLKRYPKLSAQWYSNFLKGNSNSYIEITEVGKSSIAYSSVYQPIIY